MLDQRLRKAEIHLTYKCDLACRGCNRASFSKKVMPPKLTMARYQEILDEIEELGFLKELVIIGGEPTLHPECIKMMREAKARGFKQTLWSNGYSNQAKEVIASVYAENLGSVNNATQKKESYVGGFINPNIFCSPLDQGNTRIEPCKWATTPGGCGYSADQLGYTPCPIGSMVAFYTCPEAIAKTLTEMMSEEYLARIYQVLCKHCGSYYPLRDKSKTQWVEGTLMTETWIKALQCTG